MYVTLIGLDHCKVSNNEMGCYLTIVANAFCPTSNTIGLTVLYGKLKIKSAKFKLANELHAHYFFFFKAALLHNNKMWEGQLIYHLSFA